MTGGAFEVMRLSANVWAAIGTNGGSNASFIRTDDGVIVVDALSGNESGRQFREAVATETGKPVRCVVITHHHADHWAGLSAWTDVPVVAHPRMVGELSRIADEYDLKPGDVLPFPALLQLWVGGRAADALGVASQNGVVRRLRELAQRDAPRFWLPESIEPGTVLADGAGVRVLLEDLGPGHGVDDFTVDVLDGGQRIRILGDQAFFGRVPVVGGPNVSEWISLTESFASDSEEIFVPGHGMPGDASWLRPQADYLRMLSQNPDAPLPSNWSDERSRDWHEINARLIRLYSAQ
jgi:glyoxylase-like metal-dependent hydrolase (beta-lactamase superfamily II)